MEKINNSPNKDNDSEKKAFGTLEWACTNVNFISGCYHDCKYCYAKSMAVRFKRKTKTNWKIEEIREKSIPKSFKKFEGRVMFPSSHDIQPKHINESLKVIRTILESGNEILIVTKPHRECIEAICEEFKKYKDKILFRFTIGSIDSETLEFWEPNAPSFEERFECLEHAYLKGFKTSVSAEPFLDDNVYDVIDITMPFLTDSIWVGKANKLASRLKFNGVTDSKSLKAAKELDEWQANDDNIIALYNRYKKNKKVMWKESIKKVLDKNNLKY